jgi:hypothetical protein
MYGVLDQGRGCLLVFDEPKAPLSALFLLSFHTSSHLIITPAEYIHRHNRYSNDAAAWMVGEREMRERLRKGLDAREAKEQIGVSVGYKRDIGEMLVFLSQCERRRLELAENETKKAELETKEPEFARIQLRLQGKEVRCRPQEDAEAQAVAEVRQT